MDIIIEYLIQKGGIFGALFAISLAWIVFREKQLLGRGDNDKKKSDSEDEETEEEPKKNSEIDKLILSIDEIKKEQAKSFKKIEAVIPNIEQIQSLNKSELTKIEKVFTLANSMEPKVSDMEKKISDLWQWHAVKDSDGVPVWYVRKSIEDSINRLRDSIESFDENFHKVNKTIIMDLDEKLQKVNDDRVSELKKLLETYNKTVTDLVIALEKIKFLLKSREDGE